ncbi:MAG: DUF456 domain-containing protein [Bacteroidota bacterium]
MADYLLLSLGIVAIIVGLAGCILPVIPGPPISWLGLLALNYTRWADFSFNFMLLTFLLAVVVTILDYVVPVWGTKRFGGTKAGIWGATIGLVVGLFILPPLGIILFPFLGALAGEVMSGKDGRQSLRAALGSFFGFLMGIGIKLIASFLMTYYFIVALIK